MTARSQVDIALGAFRAQQAAAASQRELVLAQPIDTAQQSGAGWTRSPGGGVAHIVSTAQKWTTDDEVQSKDYRFDGILKLLGAIALVVAGLLLSVWFVGLVF